MQTFSVLNLRDKLYWLAAPYTSRRQLGELREEIESLTKSELREAIEAFQEG